MQDSRYWREHGLARAVRIMIALATCGAAGEAGAASTSVYLFNVGATTLYAVARNGVPVASVPSSDDAAVAFQVDAVPGDVLSVVADGDLQPPSPPVVTGLSTPTPGCAHASWSPSGDPDVVGYVVGYGGQSVAGGDAPGYEFTADAGTASQIDVCSLPAGTWYFAVRARNHLGVLSAYSAEHTVVIITVAVLISEFDANAHADGVHLAWSISTDEAVAGYRIYRRIANGPETPVHDELLAAGDSGFVDRTVENGTTYSYVLGVVKEDGDEVRSITRTVTTPALTLSLEQNVPNPFNPSTEIAFSLPEAAHVDVRIYDVRGARVATLHGGVLDAGRHVLAWSGHDDAGSPVASGTYFYTLATGGRSLSRKMVLLK